MTWGRFFLSGDEINITVEGKLAFLSQPFGNISKTSPGR